MSDGKLCDRCGKDYCICKSMKIGLGKEGDGRKDGGPAFPMPSELGVHDGKSGHEGMSLRDYFAAAALPAIIAGTSQADPAKTAYVIADAMLYAREHKRSAP